MAGMKRGKGQASHDRFLEQLRNNGHGRLGGIAANRICTLKFNQFLTWLSCEGEGHLTQTQRSLSAEMSRPLTPQTERLDGLDAIRGIAAFIVLMHHAENLNHNSLFFSKGYLAVDVFFVLSGYVMARTYDARFSSGLSVRAFMWGRLRRLWPTMAVGTLLGGVALWGREDSSLVIHTVIMGLLFIPNISAGENVYVANSPAWSIFFELFANFCHALFLTTTRTLWLVLTVLAVSLLLVVSLDGLSVGFRGDNFWFGFPRVIYSYLLGVLIWRILPDGVRVPSWAGILLLIAAFIARQAYTIYPSTDPAQPWLDFLFVFIISPLTVMCSLAPLRGTFRPLVLLGTISFPLYAIHFPVLTIAVRAGLDLPTQFLAVLISSIALAWLTTTRRSRRRFGKLSGA